MEMKQVSFSPVSLAHWRTTLVYESYTYESHIECGKDPLDRLAQLAAQREGMAVSSFSGMLLHAFSKELIVMRFWFNLLLGGHWGGSKANPLSSQIHTHILDAGDKFKGDKEL